MDFISNESKVFHKIIGQLTLKNNETQNVNLKKETQWMLAELNYLIYEWIYKNNNIYKYIKNYIYKIFKSI